MAHKGIQLFAIILAAGTIRKRNSESDEYTERQIKDDTFAGVVSLLNTDLNNSVTEIGHVSVLLRYRSRAKYR